MRADRDRFLVATTRGHRYEDGVLRGELVVLRAREPADVPILHAELHEDVLTRSRADSRPWVPRSVSQASPFGVRELSDDAASFSIFEIATGELAGAATVWGIDTHNRLAHLGMALRPAFRGRGLGGDLVRVLTAYGFRTRGFNRLQLETLADNKAMIASAIGAGYRHEGTLHKSAWVDGEFLDEVILGQLADDWVDQPRH